MRTTIITALILISAFGIYRAVADEEEDPSFLATHCIYDMSFVKVRYVPEDLFDFPAISMVSMEFEDIQDFRLSNYIWEISPSFTDDFLEEFKFSLEFENVFEDENKTELTSIPGIEIISDKQYRIPFIGDNAISLTFVPDVLQANISIVENFALKNSKVRPFTTSIEIKQLTEESELLSIAEFNMNFFDHSSIREYKTYGTTNIVFENSEDEEIYAIMRNGNENCSIDSLYIVKNQLNFNLIECEYPPANNHNYIFTFAQNFTPFRSGDINDSISIDFDGFPLDTLKYKIWVIDDPDMADRDFSELKVSADFEIAKALYKANKTGKFIEIPTGTEMSFISSEDIPEYRNLIMEFDTIVSKNKADETYLDEFICSLGIDWDEDVLNIFYLGQTVAFNGYQKSFITKSGKSIEFIGIGVTRTTETLAHEIAHYYGLEHIEDKDPFNSSMGELNLMAAGTKLARNSLNFKQVFESSGLVDCDYNEDLKCPRLKMHLPK